MIGIIMALYLIIAGFMITDLWMRVAYLAVAALFYIGFCITTK